MKKNLSLYTSFFKIGILTFGGGLAMLPMLTKECVEKHKWTTEEELLDYYAIGQCTPGIIAVNTATFIGYKENGVPGAAFATAGVVSPSLIIITVIAALLSMFMDNPIIAHALAGIRIAVCGMLLNTVLTLVKKGVINVFGFIVFLAGLVLAFLTPVPTIVIILLAALSGILFKGWEAKKS